MRCEQKVVRRGKQVLCEGIIMEVISQVENRRERDYVCDTCGSKPYLSPIVEEPSHMKGFGNPCTFVEELPHD